MKEKQKHAGTVEKPDIFSENAQRYLHKEKIAILWPRQTVKATEKGHKVSMAKASTKVDTEKVHIICTNHQARLLAKAILITMDWRRITGMRWGYEGDDWNNYYTGEDYGGYYLGNVAMLLETIANDKDAETSETTTKLDDFRLVTGRRNALTGTLEARPFTIHNNFIPLQEDNDSDDDNDEHTRHDNATSTISKQIGTQRQRRRRWSTSNRDKPNGVPHDDYDDYNINHNNHDNCTQYSESDEAIRGAAAEGGVREDDWLGLNAMYEAMHFPTLQRCSITTTHDHTLF